MLGTAMVVPTIGVKDIKRAAEFYEGKLGLEKTEGEDEGNTYKCGGGTMIYVYESEYGGTNQATCAYWQVDDLDSEMKEMRAKGVTFEDYDMPGMKTENGVASWEDGKLKAAWFKDPDGNILNVMEMGK